MPNESTPTREGDISQAGVAIACAQSAGGILKVLGELYDRAFVAGVNFSEQHYRYRTPGDER